MVRTWSTTQRQAIELREQAVLVSAGAGSGKTSVLVERVITRVLQEDVDIDRILLVTFTDAAAHEMKERIAKALRDQVNDPKLGAKIRRQQDLLERATISTLHSFCMMVIRLAILQLPIEPGFRMMDDGEQKALREQVLDAMLEDFFQEGDPLFLDFVRSYGSAKGEEAIRSLIVDVYTFATSQPNPLSWLDDAVISYAKAADEPLSQSAIGQAFLRFVNDAFEQALALWQEALLLCQAQAGPEKYLAILEDEREKIMIAFGYLREGDMVKTREAISFSFLRLPADKSAEERVKERIKALRDAGKKILASLQEGVFARNPEVWQEEVRMTLPHVRQLVHLVKEFASRFFTAKRKLHALEFSDLEHLAYEALCQQGQRTTLADQLSEHFIEVMVDEFQDTSPIQDALIAQIAHPDGRNTFFVGDVKQSIYRFRMAEPQLFLNRLAMNRTSPTGTSILLTQNYRSRFAVVDVVNDVFAKIFVPALGGMSYDRDAQMISGAKYPVCQEKVALDEPVQVAFLLDDVAHDEQEDEDNHEDSADRTDEEQENFASDGLTRTQVEREAIWIGHKINALLAEQRQVFDPSLDAYRPLAYRDIAILLRSSRGRASSYMQILQKMNIPIAGEVQEGFFEHYEVRLSLALLAILDNPLQDIPLVAVLRSPLFGFRSSELAQIRLAKKGAYFDALYQVLREDKQQQTQLRSKIDHFVTQLQHWRTITRLYSVADAVSMVFVESGMDGVALALSNPTLRQKNLEAIVAVARFYDEAYRQPFAEFVQFLSHYEEQAIPLGDAMKAEVSDAVSLMTIHKSKGLEFPVVFMAGLSQRFRLKDKQPLFALHRTHGFGPQFVDAHLRLRYDTIASLGLRDGELRDRLAEEARILYVGMTRARESLILVATMKENQLRALPSLFLQADDEAPLPDSQVLLARSYMDWLLPIIQKDRRRESPLWVVTEVPLSLRDGIEELQESGQESLGIKNDEIDWDAVKTFALDALPVAPSIREESQKWLEAFQERFSSSDKAQEAMPTKIGVTAWKQQHEEQEEQALGRLPSWHEANMKPKTSELPKPSFLFEQKLTPAQKGTAFHKVMQRLALTAACLQEKELEEMLHNLVLHNVLSEQEVQAIDRAAIIAFFQTDIGRKMIENPQSVRREVSFTMVVSTEEIRQGRLLEGTWDANQTVIVQGTVDAIYLEEDKITIIDYKTDRLAKGQILPIERYEMQMAIYRAAMERAFYLPVTKVCLYFTQARKIEMIDQVGS